MGRKRKGQSTVEYALIIGVIVASLVAMQTYVKRGLQARYRDGMNFLATETTAIGNTTQYEPYYLDSSYDTTSNREIKEVEKARGDVTRTLGTDEVNFGEKTTRAAGGHQTVKGTSVID